MIKVLYVSGYKASELGVFKQDDPHITFIKKAIRKELFSYIDQGLEWVMVSGQLGVELWAAEVALEIKKVDKVALNLAIITPFLDQEKNWSDSNKEWYESIVSQADYVASITNKPYENPSQFQLKNQFVINKSDGLLLLYDSEKEGSPKYIYRMAGEYQQKYDYDIKTITFDDLQWLMEEEWRSAYEE